jgi:hypothetical protein
MTGSSRKRGSQLGEISYNEIRLMWCLAKWPLAASMNTVRSVRFALMQSA